MNISLTKLRKEISGTKIKSGGDLERRDEHGSSSCDTTWDIPECLRKKVCGRFHGLSLTTTLDKVKAHTQMCNAYIQEKGNITMNAY